MATEMGRCAHKNCEREVEGQYLQRVLPESGRPHRDQMRLGAPGPYTPPLISTLQIK